MSFLKRLLSKDQPNEQIELATVQTHFSQFVPTLENQEVEPALIHARLADGFRQADVEPLPTDEWPTLVKDVDEHGWRRLALLSSALDLVPLRQTLPKLTTQFGIAAQIRDGFIAPAVELKLLTVTLLRQSELRLEEFTRQFLARMGLRIKGETPKQSAAHLFRLDYARLLAEADKAKLSAAERVEYLKKLQEKQAPRRGKW